MAARPAKRYGTGECQPEFGCWWWAIWVLIDGPCDISCESMLVKVLISCFFCGWKRWGIYMSFVFVVVFIVWMKRFLYFDFWVVKWETSGDWMGNEWMCLSGKGNETTQWVFILSLLSLFFFFFSFFQFFFGLIIFFSSLVCWSFIFIEMLGTFNWMMLMWTYP